MAATQKILNTKAFALQKRYLLPKNNPEWLEEAEAKKVLQSCIYRTGDTIFSGFNWLYQNVTQLIPRALLFLFARAATTTDTIVTAREFSARRQALE